MNRSIYAGAGVGMQRLSLTLHECRKGSRFAGKDVHPSHLKPSANGTPIGELSRSVVSLAKRVTFNAWGETLCNAAMLCQGLCSPAGQRGRCVRILYNQSIGSDLNNPKGGSSHFCRPPRHGRFASLPNVAPPGASAKGCRKKPLSEVAARKTPHPLASTQASSCTE